MPILMDLTLYQHHKLSAFAFDVLCQIFSQRKCFLQSLQRMQLLVDATSVETYKVLQEEVGQLRVLAENAEIWMQLSRQSDSNDMRTTERILRHITSLCFRCRCCCCGVSSRAPRTHSHTQRARMPMLQRCLR